MYLFIGVSTYSVISGSITSIIINYDQVGNKNLQKHSILNRLLKDDEITPELHQEMKVVIEKQEEISNKEDLVEFLDDLPIRLKIKTVMYVYKEAH
jgi:hypothetical protein